MRYLVIGLALATVSSAAVAAPMSNCKIRASHNHIGVEAKGRFVDVGYEQATMESSTHAGSAVLSIFTLGITPVSGKAYAVFDGAHSEVQVKDRKLVIVDLDAELGSKPQGQIKLVKLNVAKKNRSIAVAEASESLVHSSSKDDYPPKAVIPITFKQVEKSCLLDGRKVSEYKAVPVKPLAPGEYAIAYNHQLFYPFGVK